MQPSSDSACAVTIFPGLPSKSHSKVQLRLVSGSWIRLVFFFCPVNFTLWYTTPAIPLYPQGKLPMMVYTSSGRGLMESLDPAGVEWNQYWAKATNNGSVIQSDPVWGWWRNCPLIETFLTGEGMGVLWTKWKEDQTKTKNDGRETSLGVSKTC